MSKQIINIGVSPNDNTGTPLRDAFDMINDNFNEIYALNGGSAAFPSLGTSEQVLRVNSGGTALEFFDLNSALSAYLPLTGGTLTGDLGIKVASPSRELDVNGNIQLSDPSYAATRGLYGVNGPIITFNGSNFDTQIAGGAIRINPAVAQMNFKVDGNNDFLSHDGSTGETIFSYSGSEKMRIEASGNVGIGTTSPSSKLHVSGGGIRLDFNQRLQWDNGNTRIQGGSDTRMYLKAPLGYYFETNGGYRLSIDGSSGNVGIGTTSPASRLHITDSAPILKLQSSSNTSSTVSFDNSSGTRRASLSFSEATDYLSLKNESGSGLVGFTPSQGEFTIGSFAQAGVIITNQSLTLKSNYSSALTCNYIGNVGIKQTNPTEALDVNGNGLFSGNLTCVALTQTSERDSKENILDINKTKAVKIPFKEYRYKRDIDRSERKRYGVVVEDIEQFYPELVYTSANGAKSVNYIDLLVKRVAELEKELEDTNKKFNNIESISFEKEMLKIAVEGKEFFFRQA